VWPLSTTSGYACDGPGGAVRWQAGAGADARALALRRQDDMNKALSALAHDRAVQGTALGGEATDDANDARNRSVSALPQLGRCDALAHSRIAWSLPAGIAAFAAGLGFLWLIDRGLVAIHQRPRPEAAGPPPICPLCGATLDVDGICAACNGFEAGHTGDWWTRLPDAPPDTQPPRDS